jgi:RNA polymerase sigma-70 factor (ECF subfamily)
MSDSEPKDIRASQNGDHEAYRRLVLRHEASISRLMWRFSQQIHICEELVHDTFVEAYGSLGGYQFQGSFSAWLKRIATRRGYRYWKQRDRDQKYVALDDVEPLEAPTSHRDAADASALVDHLLAQVKPIDRLILTLLYLEDCNTKDIARRLGWTRGMVKMRAYRARKKLRSIVERAGLLDRPELGVPDGERVGLGV